MTTQREYNYKNAPTQSFQNGTINQNKSVITQVYKLNPAQSQTFVIENHTQVPTTTRQIYHNIQIDTVPELQQQQFLQKQLRSPQQDQEINFLPIQNQQQQILHQHFIPSNQVIEKNYEPEQQKVSHEQVINQQQYIPQFQKKIYIVTEKKKTEPKQAFKQPPQQNNTQITNYSNYSNYQLPITKDENNKTEVIQEQILYSKPKPNKEIQQQIISTAPVSNISNHVTNTKTTTFKKVVNYPIENNNPNVNNDAQNQSQFTTYILDNHPIQVIQEHHLDQKSIPQLTQHQPICQPLNKVNQKHTQHHYYIQQQPHQQSNESVKQQVQYGYEHIQPPRNTKHQEPSLNHYQQNISFYKKPIVQPQENLKDQEIPNHTYLYEHQTPQIYVQKLFESTNYIPNRQPLTFTTNFNNNPQNTITYKQYKRRSKSADSRHT